MKAEARSVSRRAAHLVLSAALLALAAPSSGQATAAQAKAWPTRQIRLVVPYPPGGFTDILGRLIADRLGASLGEPVVVENRGGGGSSIGTAMVAKSPADGYTLLLVAADFAINESLIPAKLSYDARKDFAPVIRAAWSPMVLVVNPALAAASVKEFVALAKAQPGRIAVASGGNGTGSHLALEMFKSRAGVDLLHVPYKGNGPAMTDLLGGQVSAMFLQYAVAKPQIAAGKLRVLATPSDKRLAVLPEAPTIAESGLPGFDVEPWFGVVAPAGTPPSVITILNTAIAGVMQQPDVKKLLSDQGAEATTSTPEQFASFIGVEISRWGKVVKDAGVTVD